MKILAIAAGVLLVVFALFVETTSRQSKTAANVKRQDAWLAAVIGIGGLLLVFWGLKETQPAAKVESFYPQNEEPASVALYVAGAGHIGCRNQDDMRTLIRLSSQRDREVYAKAVTTALAAGLCQELPVNQVLEREDFTWDGLVRIRFQSEPNSWWTYVEATTSR